MTQDYETLRRSLRDAGIYRGARIEAELEDCDPGDDILPLSKMRRELADWNAKHEARLTDPELLALSREQRKWGRGGDALRARAAAPSERSPSVSGKASIAIAGETK